MAGGALAVAQRICEALGPSPATTQMWLDTVAYNDALTQMRASERALFAVAQQVGYTDADWRALKGL